ncbi:MAG: folylpolyglutamate synthase/dihydrofolate synthase family protein [Acidimicrobiales bacterium]|jgi:dihydrofolate synthase/folylpolyglutamate synthase|nr:folylpolyglutamate synthase/dihydrofolate synthase family protein [Acidimicrobiales bacterium]MDP6298962.1 folylpolyglutamate synthase/dihydrofolate synthase family protein [Acidimicrobiales bacterium]HJM27805.1 folylpolyglutamate synthase/dihydrofolate synthase family protein [Acidimicrobiales bacterium]HJM97882.1 folylpolyglutamate synthase/dihydrofolate synthase family protein [Acidimicrobiales bacterium]
MHKEEALHFLNQHINRRLTRENIDDTSLRNMQALLHLLGDPQLDFPILHITGTNGKGSTSAFASNLFAAMGLKVGTYSSPHVSSITERIQINTEPITDDEFSDLISHLALVEPALEITPSWFELMTAAAFRCFADNAVDLAVVEVGMLGRFDATNIADAKVSVITNVGYDHTDGSQDWRQRLAWEKAGIIKKGCILCLGETDEDLEEVFLAESPQTVLRRNVDFECSENDLAVGGRHLQLRTMSKTYENIFLAQHGWHQGNNASIALAAVEAFLDSPIPDEVVKMAFTEVNLPGRFEVVNSAPLFILDGAHNPPGAIAAAETLRNGFPHSGNRILIVGMTEEKNPEWMLTSLEADQSQLVICTQAESPRAMPAEKLAQAASSLVENVITCPDPRQALKRAFEFAGDEDVILGTGSMYVVGALREAYESYKEEQK